LEWFDKIYQAYKQQYADDYKEFYAHPAIAFIEPFKMADRLYYVGDKEVCVHLLETDEGLILFDSGFFHTKHLLFESIRKLGFDPADVKWILHTHEHYDHCGASDDFKRLYDTKLAISKEGADALKKWPRRGIYEWGGANPYIAVPEFDYLLQDGEIFEFGGVKIRCVLTPGHAEGVMSFFFDVTDNGKTYLAGLFGGAGTYAMRLPDMLSMGVPLDMPQKMMQSLDLLEKEPVSVHLGNHPNNNETVEKREKQLKEGGNPFVDNGESWNKFLGIIRGRTVDIIANNEQLMKTHNISV